MAWLLHPDDFDELLGRCTPSSAPMPLGAVAVSPCFCLARGHVQDTDHPELGSPTFAEYGEAHTKIMEVERIAFERAMVTIEKLMAKDPRMVYPGVRSYLLLGDLDELT